MKKIPLEATLGGAYRFLFTRILSIIGTIWLPLVLLIAIGAGLVYWLVPHAWLAGQLPTLHAKDIEPAMVWAMCRPFIVGAPIFGVAVLIVYAMMITGLMGLSLGQKTTPTFVYFSLGANVWRMILAFILCEIVVIVLAGILTALVMLFKHLAMPYIPHPGGPLLFALLIIVAVCVFLYTAVRLTFFIPAVVVAENRIGLGRSWELGGGNFWRIIVIYLLVLLPVAIVAGIISQMTVLPAIMSQIVVLPHDAPPAQVIHAFLKALLPVLPTVVAIRVLAQLAMIGLVAGAAGTAYNAVTAEDEPKAGA